MALHLNIVNGTGAIDPAQYLPIVLFPEYDFYKDIEGNPRQKGGKWSIGAYEYVPAKK